MMHDPKHPPSVDEAEQLAAPQSVPSERLSAESPMSTAPAFSDMSTSVLAEHCRREISNYRNGEPSDEHYGLELFRRATLQDDPDAWVGLQQCFSGIVLNWLHRHPNRETACCFDSEENYVAQTFERFWLATAHNQRLEFKTLAAALQYLRASLNGVILDALRSYSRSKEIPLPEPDTPGEPFIEDTIDGGELWELLQTMFPHQREQRLIYLSFYCGLKPREIVRYCPQEFSDVREVYRLRRNIYDQLLRDADHLRWRLGTNEDRIDMNVDKNYNFVNSANFNIQLQGGNDMQDSAGSRLTEHAINILPANEGDEGALRLSTVGTERFLCPDCNAEILVLEEKVVEFRQGQGLEVDVEDIYVLVQVEHQATDKEKLLLLSTGEVGPDTLVFDSLQLKTLQELITNNDSQPLAWNAAITFHTGEGWLSLDHTSGTVPAHNQDTVDVMADPGSLADGTYQATILFTLNGQSAHISVVLNVGTSKKLILTGHGGPKVTPSSLSFGSIVQGSSNPLPLHLLVTNNDDTTSLTWKMTNMAGGSFNGAAWLSLSSTSGTVPGLSQQRIRVNAQPGSLPRGSYSATLTFNLQVGSFNINPQVTVSLTIQ